MLDSTNMAIAPYFVLHYGTARTPLVQVVPDVVYPDMWCMVWPDGRLSDLGNLSRIKDAALILCERGPPRRNARLLHWKINRCESPSGARTRVLERGPAHPYPGIVSSNRADGEPAGAQGTA
jgi:hypothetical protein